VHPAGGLDGHSELVAAGECDGVGVRDEGKGEDVAWRLLGIIDGAEVRAVALEGNGESAADAGDDDRLARRADVRQKVRVHEY
jgi:hypothetical protein